MKIKLALSVFLLSLLPALAHADAPPALDVDAKQIFMVDVATGTVLYDKNADQKMAPSSMSKMMTAYLVFEALKNGKLKMDDQLPVSEHAWKQEGSRMFLNLGENAKVEDLIRGMIIQSGNDAAVTLAEALGAGSESTFADLMNAKAQELGLTGSHFANATGLPDPNHYSTARDLAGLAMELIYRFPEYYHYFSELTFTYNGIAQGNRNPLLYRNMNVDGLKTGHTDDGGYGLTASAVRDGRRIVAVLNGMQDMQERADDAAKVLDYGYREFGLYSIVKAGDVIVRPTIWLGHSPSVDVVSAQDVAVTLPRDARSGLKAVVSFDQPVLAPIAKGQQLGTLTVTAPGMATKTIPLIATADVAKLGFLDQLIAKFKYIFGGKKA